jgi:hypothetical protein
MADAEVKRHDTKHLDRHNDYIAVYEVPVTGGHIRFSDGGEAIEDLLNRVPDTATPHDVVAVVGRAMKEVERCGCWVATDMHIEYISWSTGGEFRDRNISIIARAYLAVDRIDVEEVLAGEPQGHDH